MFQPGREVRIETKSKTYVLARLEYGTVLQIRDWIAEREKDRFDDVKAMWEFLSDEQRRAWTEEAKQHKDQLRAFSLACPLAQKYLGTELLVVEILYLLLQKHHPGTSRDEAFQLLAAVGASKANTAIQQAQGSPPKNADAPAA